MRECTVRVHPNDIVKKYAIEVDFVILEYAICNTHPIDNSDF